MPTITLLEMHYLTVRGRAAEGTPERLTALLDEPNSAFEPYPMDTAVAVAATQAPWHLGDPADRVIAGIPVNQVSNETGSGGALACADR